MSSARCAEVAVVVPAFNAEATIEETLASALGQAGIAEIVVVDDGSEDGTGAIARSFGARVQVLSGPNRGVSAARNRGIGATTAGWLLFLDADDVLRPGTVARRLDLAAATGADIVVCGWQELVACPARGWRQGKRCTVDRAALASDTEAAIATHVWAPPGAILYRRSLVERIGGFRETLPVIEDARFLFDAAAARAFFACDGRVGLDYRVRARSLSRRDPALFWANVLRNGRQIEALWRAQGRLVDSRLAALAKVYRVAAEGLLEAGHGGYYEAMAARHALPDEEGDGRWADWLAKRLGVQSVGRFIRVRSRLAAQIRTWAPR